MYYISPIYNDCVLSILLFIIHHTQLALTQKLCKDFRQNNIKIFVFNKVKANKKLNTIPHRNISMDRCCFHQKTCIFFLPIDRGNQNRCKRTKHI